MNDWVIETKDVKKIYRMGGKMNKLGRLNNCC
jgi:hypothetical protein